MPYKSDAQRKFIHAKKSEIFNEMVNAVKNNDWAKVKELSKKHESLSKVSGHPIPKNVTIKKAECMYCGKRTNNRTDVCKKCFDEDERYEQQHRKF